MADLSYRKYLAVLLLLAVFVTSGRAAWRETVKIGCLPVGGVAPADTWLNDCNADTVGEYAHSAVWFDLVPSVAPAVRAAKVLFFGDSKVMFALSRGDASQWFEAEHTPFYILGFIFEEQSGWAEMLLKKFRPHPAVMVFDTTPYFTGRLSIAAQAIVAHPDEERTTALAIKSFYQEAALYCGYVPWLCGRTTTLYRSDADGHELQQAPERAWFGTGVRGAFPITAPPKPDTSLFKGYLAHAQAVIDEAGIDPHCVVFTIVPNSDMDGTLANFLANRLGAQAITPQLDGLTTSDRLHLTTESARAWTSVFLPQLKPILQKCAGTLSAG